MRRLTVSLALVSAPLAAQTPALPPATDTGDIIVTAQRRAEPLQTTPVAVTALGTAQLEAQRILRTDDLGKSVPNLTILPLTASPSSFQISLRGGTEQAGAIVTSEPAVAVYVDDVYRGRISGSNLELADIERIEVLRGPQGTLYGRNAYSGAIKVITRKPGPTSWLDASIAAGRFDAVRGQASAGGPVADGLGASIALLYRDQSGYIYNQAVRRFVGRESAFASRGTLNYFRDGPFKATASIGYTRDRNDGYNAVPVTFPPGLPILGTQTVSVAGCFYCNLTPVVGRGENEQFSATLNASYELGEAATLRSISAYVRTDDLFRWDLAGGSRTPTGFAAGFVRNSKARSNQWSQELQLSGEAFDKRLNYLAGIYFFHEDSLQTLNDVSNGFPLLPTTLDTTTNSFAAFAQGTYKVAGRVGLTAGIRYTRDRKRLNGSIQSGFAPPITLVPVARRDVFDGWTPKLGIDFEASRNLFAYASVSRGFKAGGYNGLAVGNPLILAAAYGPQTVWAYELGLKLTSTDRRSRVNVSVFRNELKGLQQTATIAPFSFATQNVGDARLDGVEVEASTSPVRGLNLNASLGYMDDKYRRLTPGSTAAINNARRLPLVPHWTYQLGGNYTSQPIGGTGLKLKFSANYYHTSTFFPSVDNVSLTRAYGRLDGSIGVATEDDRWELTASGRNVLSDRTYVSIFTFNAATPGRPADWLITLRYRR